MGAVAMAEASYLLKVPRAIEPAGWEQIKRDHESGELAPPEVLALITRDPVLWQAKIEVLRNVGREVLEIPHEPMTSNDTSTLFRVAWE